MNRKTDGFSVEVERGPNWLFLHLVPGSSTASAGQLADRLWTIVSTHFTYRVVVEFDGSEALDEQMIQQLDHLRQRLEDHDGALRVCGLNRHCAMQLEAYCNETQTDSRIRSHSSVADAVLGPGHAHDLPRPPHRLRRTADATTSDTAPEVVPTR